MTDFPEEKEYDYESDPRPTRLKNYEKKFIIKAKELHPDYLYHEVVGKYENSATKVNIWCTIHEEFFLQTPGAHVASKPQGCPKCGHKKRSDFCRSNADEFIKKAEAFHGKGKYLYHLVIYINNSTKVDIWCVKCNEIRKQCPSSHLNHGCKVCGKEISALKQLKDENVFIKEAIEIHGEDKYSYDKVIYTGAHNKVKIYCKKHEYYFEQTPHSHVHHKSLCVKCGYEYVSLLTRKDQDVFIKEAVEIHGEDKYSYNKVEYVNSKTKINIYCKKHKKYFLQEPHCHLSGQGCPSCINKTEGMLHDWLLKNITKDVISQFKFNNSKFKYDFMFSYKNKKIILELDGEQHFIQVSNWKSPEHAKQRDIEKIILANEEGYHILHLLQDDVYYNKNNWDKKLIKYLNKLSSIDYYFIDTKNIYKSHIIELKETIKENSIDYVSSLF
jgi:very-short-patch-repair endonuclease